MPWPPPHPHDANDAAPPDDSASSGGLAEGLERDFAFADTVALARPLPLAAADVDLATRLRVLITLARDALHRSREEMRELWAGTAEMVDGNGSGSFLRRILALWSCFEWSRTDLTRAAMIGVAVFVTAGAIGAATVDFGDGAEPATRSAGSSSAASSTEVRPGRTLDQHTGRNAVVHPKH